MPEIHSSKNILYNTGALRVEGNLHIGDIIYRNREELRYTVLYLDLQPDEQPGRYRALLSFKCRHPGGGALPTHLRGQRLLEEAVEMEVPARLFEQLKEFGHTRRQVGQLRYAAQLSPGELIREELELAEQLYRTLMVGDIKTVTEDFISLLERSKIKELLLAIHSSAPELMDIPWEMALPLFFPPKGDEPQGLGPDNFAIVRTFEASLAAFDMGGARRAAAPLKLLFVAALPEDLPEGGKFLEIEKEQQILIAAIGSLEAGRQPRILIEWLDHASLENIDKALEQRRHDIVHISGHGAYVEALQSGVLYLEDENGDERRVSGHELGSVLRRHSCVKLLMLSACETGRCEGGGFVEAAAQYGIPAIVGMRFPVTDPGAILFTSVFYEQLAKGSNLSRATFLARHALWADIRTKREKEPEVKRIAEWFTPFVFVNHYTGSFIAEEQPYRVPEDFYPRSTFRRSWHSRTLGSGFIGRKKYLIQLRRAFNEGRHVCLQGLGGLGKTTLAEAFAENYRNRSYELLVFRGGKEIQEKYIIERLGKRHANNLRKLNENRAEEFLAYLQSDDEPEKKLRYLLHNHLRGRHTILLFDNFEDWQDAPHRPDRDTGQGGEAGAPRAISSPALATFLTVLCQEAPPGCHLLFTTRYPIPSLEKELLHLPLGKMGYAETYRFFNFSERLRSIPLPHRQAIFSRLDGHPRAFEFLAALLEKDAALDWTQMEEKLDKVSADIYEDLLLEELYLRLSEEERQVLCYASIFQFPTERAALAAVSGRKEAALNAPLDSLSRWSLCYLDGEGRFEVHRLTAAYLRENHIDKEERKEWLLGAAGYFKGRRDGEGKMHVADGLLTRHYYKEAEAWEQFAEETFLLEDFYSKSGYYHKARELMEEVLEVPLEEEMKAKTFHTIGILYQHFGEYGSALEYYQKSLKIRGLIGNTADIASSLHQIGMIHQKKGEYGQALQFYKDSLKIKEQIGNNRGIAKSLHQIGRVHEAKGEHDQALQFYQNSLKIEKQIGNTPGIADSLHQIGIIHQKKGEYTHALELYQRSLKIREQIGNLPGVAFTFGSMGQLYFHLKKYKEALSCSFQAFTICKKIGSPNAQLALQDITRVREAVGEAEFQRIWKEVAG